MQIGSVRQACHSHRPSTLNHRLNASSMAQATSGVPPERAQGGARQAPPAQLSAPGGAPSAPAGAAARAGPSAAAANSEVTGKPEHAAKPATEGASSKAAGPSEGTAAVQMCGEDAASAAAGRSEAPRSAGKAPADVHDKPPAAQSDQSSGQGNAPAPPAGAARGAGQGGSVGGSAPLGLGGSLAPRRGRRGLLQTPEGMPGGLPARSNPGGHSGSRAAAPAQARRGPAAAQGADPEVEDIPAPARRARGGPQREAPPPDLGALFSSLLGGDAGGGGGGGGGPAGGGAGLEGVLGRMLQSPAMGQLVSQIAAPQQPAQPGGAVPPSGPDFGALMQQLMAPQPQQPGARAAPGGADFGALMQQMMPLVSSVSA